MFCKILTMALESAGEVIVETKYTGHGVRGRVMDFDGKSFTLFHSGNGGGMLWVFRLDDLAHCGLILDLPSDVQNWSSSSIMQQAAPSADGSHSEDR